MGLPTRREARRRREHGARRLVAVVALALLGIVAWVAWSARPAAGAAPGWDALAPSAEVPMRTWRWLVFSAGRQPGAHFAVAPAPDRDPARIEALPAWRLQQPVPGYPPDALVVAVAAPAGSPAVEARLADLAATLLARIPTLSLQRSGADRTAPPPGLDAERLRYRTRELLMRRGQTAR